MFLFKKYFFLQKIQCTKVWEGEREKTFEQHLTKVNPNQQSHSELLKLLCISSVTSSLIALRCSAL